ncbi:G-type lectin S-receptor-like serine/threonine-protein kinase At1g11300 [Solanum lycopersicum]|uniref:G-type lectin S-receptor-like serine/threonine-protein kinase At1g11300 n=1 Tax=Solanum lycopersicum TaxID=4081 RepID=UPI000532FB99|nr:G-type lectin S-receptor-like serine/threonine-protein kinase At1g11300 [Solanum lycopersicum]
MAFDGFSLANEHQGFVYFTGPVSSEFITKFVIDWKRNMVWDENETNWKITWLVPKNDCEVYGACGPFGSCNYFESPICSCLKGFNPKHKEEWEKGNWTSGCVRRRPLLCEVKNNTRDSSKEDGFRKMKLTKLPDFAERSYTIEEECRSKCLSNCSCIAYAFDTGIGCMLWSSNLIDIQQLQIWGKDLYFRVAYSELDHYKDIKKIVIAVILGTLTLCVCLLIYCTRVAIRRGVKKKEVVLLGNKSPLHMEELQVFSLDMLANAISQFHEDNKLGQGGFGPVYKAWMLWKEEDLSAFIEPFILNPSTEMEVRKCIQIGLLCVQEFAEDRPNISSVLVMLTSETTSLPSPLQPAFTESRETKCTLNNISITNLTGR